MQTLWSIAAWENSIKERELHTQSAFRKRKKHRRGLEQDERDWNENDGSLYSLVIASSWLGHYESISYSNFCAIN